MKKPLQKSIIKWYKNEQGSLSQLNIMGPFESFVVQVYIDELMFKGENTPSVVKQLTEFRNFIDDNYLYILNCITNVERMMNTSPSPYKEDYENKTKFEKVLSIHNSYLELESMVPGRGKETIEEFYNKLNQMENEK
jgi:hypothetical protein